MINHKKHRDHSRPTLEHRSSFHNARCERCNKTSSASIALSQEDYTTDSFYRTETGYVCYECESWHHEVMSDWAYEDEEEDAFEYDEEE